MKNILKRISYFKDFDDNELEELAKISFLKTYEKNEQVILEGEKSNYLHLLLKGSVKIYKTNSKGNELFLHTVNPINFVAELANFENIPYPASIRFLTSGEMIKFDYIEIQNKFLTKPSFVISLLSGMSKKLIYMSEFVHNEMILSADAKVAKLLCEDIEMFNNTKHIQIAAYINLAPETFSRILAKFKNQGIIKVKDNKNYEVVDLEYLKSFYKD